MDFIALDVEPIDVWAAFRQDVPVRAQMYEQYAQVCIPPFGGICAVDDQEKDKDPTGVTGGTSAPPRSGGDLGWDPKEEAQETPEFGEEGNENSCEMEQRREAERDAVIQAVVNEINSMDPDKEHATFGIQEGDQITTLTISTGDSQSADLVSLYNELDSRGLDMSNVIFSYIHIRSQL